jgi:GTP-binding protein HflX
MSARRPDGDGPTGQPAGVEPERELRPAERRERDRGWETKREVERAVLVAVVLPPTTRAEADEHLEELALLARTAGAEPVARLVQERRQANVRTFIGSGKVEELHQLCRKHGANLVVFDDTLSPAQARNLEKVLQLNVIDRTEVILDIFARHARSAEAKMQVELAQLQYMRPRLKQLWDHLSRQNGGIGTRGPGETQLEVDRRRVGEKISRLKAALRDRHTIAATQRKSRAGVFAAALVGYTNAGKSSLMNALAGTDLLTEDKLFSTLDATTRRVPLGDGDDVLLTDTVGFIRKLPHDLVASFRTTLREVDNADLLLHVADATSPTLGEHLETVHRVLDEILDAPRPTQLVFNKMDALGDRSVGAALRRQHPEALFVSARSGEGLDSLRALLRAGAAARSVHVELELMREAPRILSFCYREGRVLAQNQGDSGRPRLRVRFAPAAYRKLQQAHAGDFVVVDGRAGGKADS